MEVTLRDIINLPQFKGLRLITNDSGLSNVITGCGILDYEYDDRVKNRFKHTNFSSGLLALTSFLYAKDNDYLIMEAIKNLISKGCCGIVIKNIFKLNISSNLIRYAEQNNFPIFILKDQDILFENLIVNVSKIVENYSSLQYYEEKVLKLLSNCHTEEKTRYAIAQINPLFEADFLMIFFRFKSLPEKDELFSELHYLKNKLVLSATDRIIYFKKGFLFIHSSELFGVREIEKITIPYQEIFNEFSDKYYISSSSVHHDLVEFTQAIDECLYASILYPNYDVLCNYYDFLGTYKLLIPFINNPLLKSYSDYYVRILQEYDDEHQTKLLETINEYVMANGNIDYCAQNLILHKNTIRYRLEKVNTLLSENVFLKGGYEKIAAAIKIRFCEDRLAMFNEVYCTKI